LVVFAKLHSDGSLHVRARDECFNDSLGAVWVHDDLLLVLVGFD